MKSRSYIPGQIFRTIGMLWLLWITYKFGWQPFEQLGSGVSPPVFAWFVWIGTMSILGWIFVSAYLNRDDFQLVFPDWAILAVEEWLQPIDNLFLKSQFRWDTVHQDAAWMITLSGCKTERFQHTGQTPYFEISGRNYKNGFSKLFLKMPMSQRDVQTLRSNFKQSKYDQLELVIIVGDESNAICARILALRNLTFSNRHATNEDSVLVTIYGAIDIKRNIQDTKCHT